MNAHVHPAATGLSDADDRLTSADALLASLQEAFGGELPGTIAVPSLLEIVRKARRYGLKLARPMTARQGGKSITAWAEVTPRGNGMPGCAILLRNWQVTPLPADDAMVTEEFRTRIDRELAELNARLDRSQAVLVVEAEAADLQLLVAAMRSGAGRPWTDFVELEGNLQSPMHWRLLDGATVAVPGSARRWRAHLAPIFAADSQPGGFQLSLASDLPPPEKGAGFETETTVAMPGVIGRDIAPVLRQPIARIIANAETIRTRLAGPLADEYANYAADIASAGQHLLGLLEDLADVEVVEAEDFSTIPDQIDLADVARRAAGILGVRARERGIVVDAPRPGETLPALGEFRRALQIMLNLLGNAIRYSPANSEVWIRLEEANGSARAIVADQGPGLSQSQQERVFEKFERLGRGDDGGTGLGLYISRRLARAMRGDVLVQSAPGQGARFIFELPVDPG
ncbi:MAG: HAMP domain-containing sensor histidine kinase [Novosphingobium sp.]